MHAMGMEEGPAKNQEDGPEKKDQEEGTDFRKDDVVLTHGAVAFHEACKIGLSKVKRFDIQTAGRICWYKPEPLCDEQESAFSGG